MLHKAWNSKGEIPYCFPRSFIKFQGHAGQNITDLTQIGRFRTIGRSQLSNCFICFAFVFFNCDQAALWMVFSVRLSVCLSVTPLSLCSPHPIIMTFSGLITNGRSDVRAKGQGQRSKVKVTEVMTPFSRFRTVTPVWIHIWYWNDAKLDVA